MDKKEALLNTIKNGKAMKVDAKYLQGLDTIEVDQKDVEMLFRWRDNHIDYVKNYKPVLNEGIIRHDNAQLIYFYDDGIHVAYHIYSLSNDLLYAFIMHKNTGRGKVLFNRMGNGEEGFADKLANDLLGLHASLMAYMEYYGDNKEYVVAKKEKDVKHTGSRKKAKSSKKRKIVKIKRTIYKISIDEKAVKVDRKKYERQIEKWNVRGHWRETKTGKKVWVKPHVKGNGEDTTGKNYRL